LAASLEPPLVSVITATFNMAKYVREAVDSVLAQSYPHVESIVVDDGSTDSTSAVLAGYAGNPKVRIFRQENAGQTRAKNRGLQEAHGSFVGFCDADDRWRSEKLEHQVPLFTDRPRLGVVYGDFACIDAAGAPVPVSQQTRHSGKITGKLLADNFIPFPSALVRQEAIAAVGGFDESLTMSIDFDLWLRISVDWDFLHVPEALADYRLWEGQMSHRSRERLDNATRLMRRFLADHPHSATAAERRYAWAHTYVSWGCLHAQEGHPLAAAAGFLRAARQRPWDARLWRSIARALLGRL
jgi:glycosyltransferase involved in cell wall biosynthesis